MTAQRTLVADEILNLIFALFRVSFPWLFDWSEDLQSLTSANWSIPYTFRSVMVLVLLAFAYPSIVHRVELQATRLEDLLSSR